MPEFRAGTAEQVSYLDELVDAGLLTRTGVPDCTPAVQLSSTSA